MKKAMTLALSLLMVLSLAACGGTSTTAVAGTDEANAADTNTAAEEAAGEEAGEEAGEAEAPAGDFDYSTEITVVSREDGSGTRGAFIELFGIEVKNENDEKVDMTTVEANITQSTSVMMTTVSTDEYAIGYISLGSLNDSVKAVAIEGVAATVENIKNDSYSVKRPFNIAVANSISASAQDFIDFIMSAEGQAVIEDNGYIASDDAAPAYEGTGATEKIVVAGSSSVSPVMEKLIEAYEALHSGADIELLVSDSSTGMTNAIEGNCDIGMASRELKDSELESLTPIVIALDGIAVIVNNDSPIDDLSIEDVRTIFTGEVYDWTSFE